MKELFFALLIGLTFISCGDSQMGSGDTPQALFEVLDSSDTGITFTNTLTASTELNVFHYMYFYNGGGVAVGDFNNDGLEDIYFTANQEANRLYLNKGEMKFEDVTSQSGTAGTGNWNTGVATVDINNDGLLDIYVSQVGDFRTIEGRNELFINQGVDDSGIPIFKEQASVYGIDQIAFGTQAAFFDYDSDGDLDLFQMNHSVHANGTFGKREIFDSASHELSGDRLLRNDGLRFQDVTREAGILSTVIGYGLGVVPTDINNDGHTDLYIANDFHENDYLYINNGNGTFTERLTSMIQHTSRFSMGVDVADINNDGYNEIMSLDMHPEDPFILKSSLGEDDYGIFQFKLGYGYNHQYARNNLQLNNGNGSFSEIGVYSGVHATDWSWSTLFADFDNDGFRDIFVSNGIPKRMNDIDYVDFVSNNEVQYKISTDNMESKDLALTDKLPEIKIPNKLFLNQKKLKFADANDRISNDRPTYSNGSAYADLDNDGDLDLIVNNIGEAPFIYRNLSKDNGSQNHFLALDLVGPPLNTHAYGAKVYVQRKSDVIIYEHYPQRGYQSSVSQRIHVGLGDDLSVIESIKLIWPDGKFQPLSIEQTDTLLSITYDGEALTAFDYKSMQPEYGPDLTTDITAQTGIAYTHDENFFVEFNREQLLPHMLSTEGPAVAVGDLNGDGLDDIFFGNAKWKQPETYLQQSDGSFELLAQAALEQDSVFEDVDAFMADLDNDGDQDLFVASGGNEYYGTMEPLKSRVYLNNGDGVLTRNAAAIDSIFTTASCAVPYDINSDGHIDVFLGSRCVPWKYGVTPVSHLLLNDGQGNFSDVTDQWSEDLGNAGFVKDATWTDLDGDGDKDLVLALEWGPVTVYENTGNELRKRELAGGAGWYNVVYAHDFDNDGDMDLIAGGQGDNTKFKPSEDHPVSMYVNDFDDNGQVEQLLEYYIEGEKTLFPTYREVTRQLPEVKKEFLYAKDFATATVADIAGEKMPTSDKFTVTNFSHLYLENLGGFQFDVHRMPEETQFSTLHTVYATDLDGDQKEDLMLGGNFYENNIELGRYDASFGNILLNRNTNISAGQLQSLELSGQIRHITPITINGKRSVICIRNDDAPVILSLNDPNGVQ